MCVTKLLCNSFLRHVLASVVVAHGAIAQTTIPPAATLALRCEKISGAEGLPHPTVYKIVQDTAGWIWLACPRGLYRYDGVEFIRYTNQFARHEEIHNLQISEDGTLYAANFRKQIFHISGDSLRLTASWDGDLPDFESYLVRGDTLFVSGNRGVFFSSTRR